ncbi:asialoglycoprotein receptor-like 1 isoform X2 [Mugil cephalus]|nr:asialoglycoprotein receptor-like 1 isoform X2 [Mugil cephalus]
MESRYHRFGPSDSGSIHVEPTVPTQTVFTGMKRIVMYTLYGIPVLGLLILMIVTGIKLSQLNQEITDIKLHLARIVHGGTSSSSSPDATEAQLVYLEKLTPVRGACREGWVSFQRSCYLLSTTTATWSKAEEQCKTQRGHLVVLNNVEELDYISQIVEIRSYYWIGLVERQHEGHWSWVDGTDYSSTPTFWDKGQPDNWDYRENGEDCGQIHSSERRKRKLWNDADCSLSYRYICESGV